MKSNLAVVDTVHLLAKMRRLELAKLWEENFGARPHKRLRPELMRPILAFRVQEREYGGYEPDTARRLRQIVLSLAPESRAHDEARNRYKAGTRIIREWKGKTHEVLISGSGYEFEGKTYKSLSPIATRITGTRWSGPAFFGTKRSAEGK